MIRRLLLTVVAMAGLAYLTTIALFPYPEKGWEKTGSEWLALTTVLFWEGYLVEPVEGLRAIAWVVFNRAETNDSYFPDTIREVATQGVRPGRREGCQFSFACDGEVEMPERLCELHPRDSARLGVNCHWRWLYYSALSFWWLYVDRGEDPTNGAVLYYVGKEPYWVIDFEEGSVRKIGSHTFGRSKWLARDLALR